MVAIAALPIKQIQDLLSFRKVSIIAPHPDDETLGCGGAIALLRQHQIPIQVLFISDGTGSHPNSKRFPPGKLRDLREQEARAALALLGVSKEHLSFFRWPDTAVPHPGEANFIEAVEKCDRALRSHQPDLVFVPWQHDQHCDHQATWKIVQYSLQTWSAPPHQLIYSIWGATKAGLPSLPKEETGWRLDIRPVEHLKRAAAMAHRSQTTDLIKDDPTGFRLTAEMLNNLIQPYETYLEVNSMPSSDTSIQPDYFEKIYAADIDPWDFETSEYEAKKYAATIAALPKAQYQSAFEIGGSIGVLTEKLADRCNALLSVDVSKQAQAKAKERCQHLPHVAFQVMQLPHTFPPNTFDLIVVSEVGYYWGKQDLDVAKLKIADSLERSGHLMLVHWTPYVEDYPITGDEVHEAFLQQVGDVYHSLVSRREERYRLDLLERF